MHTISTTLSTSSLDSRHRLSVWFYADASGAKMPVVKGMKPGTYAGKAAMASTFETAGRGSALKQVDSSL